MLKILLLTFWRVVIPPTARWLTRTLAWQTAFTFSHYFTSDFKDLIYFNGT